MGQQRGASRSSAERLAHRAKLEHLQGSAKSGAIVPWLPAVRLGSRIARALGIPNAFRNLQEALGRRQSFDASSPPSDLSPLANAAQRTRGRTQPTGQVAVRNPTNPMPRFICRWLG